MFTRVAGILRVSTIYSSVVVGHFECIYWTRQYLVLLVLLIYCQGQRLNTLRNP